MSKPSIVVQWGFDAAKNMFIFMTGKLYGGASQFEVRVFTYKEPGDPQNEVFHKFIMMSPCRDMGIILPESVPVGHWVRAVFYRDENEVDSCSCRVVEDVGDYKSECARLRGVIQELRSRIGSLADCQEGLPNDIATDPGFEEIAIAITDLIAYSSGIERIG